MAANDITLVRHRGFVREDERSLGDRTIHTPDIDLGTRIARALVMVAAHEEDVDRRIAAPPLAHDACRLRLAAFARVEEIAEEDDTRCAGAGERGVESRERTRGRPTRHWNSSRAKRSGLAEVWVGDEQRSRALPVRGTLGQQRDALASDVRHD